MGGPKRSTRQIKSSLRETRARLDEDLHELQDRLEEGVEGFAGDGIDIRGTIILIGDEKSAAVEQ